MIAITTKFHVRKFFLLKNFYSIKKLKRKFKSKKPLFTKDLALYAFPPYLYKNDLEFRPYLYFNAYKRTLGWAKKSVLSPRYARLVKNFRNYRKYYMKTTLRSALWAQKKYRLRGHLLNYLYVYNVFFIRAFVDIFFFYKVARRLLQKHIYKLILSFKHQKFFINFLNMRKKKNYFFLSPGLFLKYFGKKKSIKKNKILKLLMSKCVRKLFLILKIKHLVLLVKQNPTFLLEFLNLLNTPIVHKFFNPSNSTVIEEKANFFVKMKFLYFIFSKNISFTSQKAKKRGRVKRKITRKLILKNALVD